MKIRILLVLCSIPLLLSLSSGDKDGRGMVFIKGGEFLMGSGKGRADEKPVHKVKVSDFYMDTREVTQKDFEMLMGFNPSRFVAADRPVDRVRWHEAAEYCNERSLKDGLKPCYDLDSLKCDFSASGYRLPTEAEWEYACRATKKTSWHFGSSSSSLNLYAWYRVNSKKSTQKTASRKASPWGLFDMYGNLREWCNDFYSETTYRNSAAVDPRGPAAGKKKVLRGGSWNDPADLCTSSARFSEDPNVADICQGYDSIGFRTVRKP